MARVKTGFLTLLKGIAMGGADVVPGVSGGTIAFITGIYPRLIAAISAVDAELFKMLFTGKFISLWKKIDGAFLLPLFIGIAISILSLAKAIKFLLETYPVVVWAFFFGLILASALLIAKTIGKWRPGNFVMLILGAVIAYAITSFTPASTPEELWFILLSGMIAISAMVLPGISGSFILVLLGKYEYVLGALTDFNIPVIATFIVGCVIGIVSVAKGIGWLLKHYYFATLALLAGFMIGSLNKVWPWKHVLEYIIDRKGVAKPVIERNVWPTEFQALSNQDPFLLEAMTFAVLGFGLVILLERLASRYQLKNVR